jgi:hypothetical protein
MSSVTAASSDTAMIDAAESGDDPGRREHPAKRASIDDLDAAIRHLARRISAATSELLVLVREFDDRFGWAKWSFPNGSEWLAWRSGISVSAAREQLRTAHAFAACRESRVHSPRAGCRIRRFGR